MAQTSFTGLVAGSSTPLLATGDVMAWVDISDTTQSPSGSLVKTTVAAWYAALPSAVNILSASANALAVGRLGGTTTPAFVVDASTASQVAGLKVVGAATGGTVAVVAIDSGADTNLTVNAKGTGTIGIGSVSTGRVTITPVTTITGALTLSAALTYGGVTLSNAVTGTGSMVLSASPTFTGTVTTAAISATTVSGTTVSASTQFSGSTSTNAVSAILVLRNDSAGNAAGTRISLGNDAGTTQGTITHYGSAHATLANRLEIFNQSATGSVAIGTNGTAVQVITSAGATSFTGAVTSTGNFVVGSSTFTVTAASGNTAVGGTLVSTGLITGNAGVTVASGQTLTLTGATVAGTPTWSSAQAITLSTAAQPNVTSLGTLAANLIFVDATYDIGASGATRPRDFFLSRNATVGGTLGVTGATTLSAALTYGGVTLSNSVTGTGSMVLSASPTFTGTVNAAAITATGAIAGASFTGSGDTNGTSTQIALRNTNAGANALVSLQMGTDLSANDLTLRTFSSGHSKARYVQLMNQSNNPLELGANGTVHVTVAGSGAVTFNGAVSGVTTLTATGLIQTTVTTEQMRLRYDASNYLSVTVASNGATTIDAVGAGAGVSFSDNIASGKILFNGLSGNTYWNLDGVGPDVLAAYVAGTQRIAITGGGSMFFPGLGAGTGEVTVGAADSGGAGFRYLRVPN